MTNLSTLLSYIDLQDKNHKAPEYVPPVPGFPLPQMYAGQAEAITQLMQHKSAIIASHTGAGKTATFLTLTQHIPTLVIEPRKFLQKQVAAYRNDTILFGRAEYPCHYASSAASAPCTRKVRCDRTNHAEECEYGRSGCTKDACYIFRHDRVWERYPCNQCKYLEAVSLAKGVIGHGGTIVCNFGNFWQFIRDADLIIIDEADLFFKEISSPKMMRHATSVDADIRNMIAKEIAAVEQEMQTCTIGQYYALKNAMYQLNFLKGVAHLCFTYKKKDKVYVEVNPANTNLLKEHIFGEKRVIVVTATPGEFNMPSIAYGIHQRCGIYYVPQGKLTARNLKMQPFLLENAADFIKTMSAIFEGLYSSQKFVVHCGNVGQHATAMNEYLEPANCILHERGNLMGTLEKFIASDRRYLLVASAEYGADFSWCNCQFVLKFPYASYDDRLKALERKLGKEQFKKFYEMDAINRLIQQCGRVGRGWDSFGCTFILDSKFGEIYGQYKNAFPQWFRERMCGEVF